MSLPAGIEIVILAAGRGSRMGGAVKALLPLHGRPLLAWITRRWVGLAASPPLVVVGYEADRVEAAFAEDGPSGQGLRFLRNTDWASGQMSSLQCALRGMPSSCEAVLVHLVDLPLTEVAVARRVCAVWQSRPGACAAYPVCEGRRGHPVLLSAALFADVLALSAEARMRDFLAQRGDDVVVVEVESSWIHRDVDRPEDLEAIVAETRGLLP